MLQVAKAHGHRPHEGMHRRAFLRIGGLAAGLGLVELAGLPDLQASSKTGAKTCIQILLVGGPSQLETWDLKPNAPSDIRGPFRPIPTNVPGIDICEHFPLMARMADRYAIVRSVYHNEAPIHETGQQLIQTGHVSAPGIDWPHCGAMLSKVHPAGAMQPAWVVVPSLIGNTGVSISHGQTAGWLGPEHEPTVMDVDLLNELDEVRSRYGWNTFGQSCLLARRLVESGVRMVTVNMFDTVFSKITWDCHANGSDLNSTLTDYKDFLCPMLDAAYSALLDDLHQSGLLDSTLVVCAGEVGRTPKLNRHGGRDHWPRVWSVLLAGGGIRGGQVIGGSDAYGAEPKDRPVHAGEIAAMVGQVMRISSPVSTTASLHCLGK